MRVRVLIDIRLPLKQFKKIKKAEEVGGMVHFKYERLGTFCYLCGLLGHSDTHCPKLFDIPEDDGKHEWSPDLRPEAHRQTNSGSRWLRSASNPNWVTPSPIPAANQCGNSNCTMLGGNHDKYIKDHNDSSNNTVQLADIFRNPQCLFPQLNQSLKTNNKNEENMEEDMEELIVEGDRKQSRNNDTSRKENEHVKEGENPCNNDEHFLLAGRGGVRQGQ
jgi:hypothetical protein